MYKTNVEYIIKRTGEMVPFQPERIANAITKAFLSENIVDDEAVRQVNQDVLELLATHVQGDTTTVEIIQDHVEDVLMTSGYHRVAKNYILYRAEHTQARQEKVREQIRDQKLEVRVNDSETIIFDAKAIEDSLRQLAPDLMRVSINEMLEAIIPQIYDKIPKHEIEALVLGVAKERIEKHYEYAKLSSRIALNGIYKDILATPMYGSNMETAYKSQFKDYLAKGIELNMLNEQLQEFDIDALSAAIQPERDKLFLFLGTQILMDRYLLRDRTQESNIYELPQWFWMRVAMGLSLKEDNPTERAISFYNVLSNLDLVSSTPTLFNSGTKFSQMSSCYLNTADDSLEHIFKVFSDNAKLSKWAGGIGTDWSRVRATGSKIKGTNGQSQGVIPFIKIFNDVALAVNQGGKRKGAMCAYMELWHMDIDQFLELKKNTGDERRRAHDINTAAWIPDLFMQRVADNSHWTLFCPSDAPELHDLYGQAFKKKYEAYEQDPNIRKKTVNASDLWRRMLTMLYETGHPWVTFKDTCNIRSPQDHVGVVHSSNLCTEITLNTSNDETAVCNLASINLSQMVENGKLNEAKIEKTLEIGIRMLDNVIDNNFYPTPEAEHANMSHRAIGLGMMGYQDALFKLDVSFDTQEGLEFADASMEMISYYAIQASSTLAKERGTYQTYKGSKWDRSIFPLDTLDVLEKERNRKVLLDRQSRLDWTKLKSFVSKHGMRNSNVMAIAPTATIANISGVYPCTEPVFKNIYMKENLSGNFIVINQYLVDDLDKLGLWNSKIVSKIKLHDGSIQEIQEIPSHIRKKYKETFEIAPEWIIKASAKRCKWIDQAASTNVFINTKSGKLISDTYKLAWEYGLKTTYYLRTLGATQVLKTTKDDSAVGDEPTPVVTPAGVKAHLISEPECEACQ